MKTPDFDDLLAAFDIPDIDAKEAIQSSPEEDHDDEGTDGDERKNASPLCLPSPPASHSDPPVVSVIVKNKVQSESFEEGKEPPKDKTDNSSSSGLNPQVKVKFSDHGPKTPTYASEYQIANGVKDPILKERGLSSTERCSSPLPCTQITPEDQIDRGTEVGLDQDTTDVNNLKPHLHFQSSTKINLNSSVPPLQHSISPHPPPSPEEDKSFPFSNPSSPSSPKNRTLKTVMHSDESDSEPDLGSPLVIQESPESETSSPQNVKHRVREQSKPFDSPVSTSSSVSLPPPLPSLAPANPKPQFLDKELPTLSSHLSSAPQPKSPQGEPSVSTDSRSVQEEKYLEHVIDERDSPESPPPSETGLVVSNNNSSYGCAQTSSMSANHRDDHAQEELMEVESREEDSSGDPQGFSEEKTEEGENLTEGSCDADCKDYLTADITEAVPTALRPLKVKIKTSTGSITRTVTGTATKRGVKTTLKGVSASKPSPECHNTRSKKELAQHSQLDNKDKISSEAQHKVSPTAVSITKTVALPSVSVTFPKVTPGVIGARSLATRGVHSGAALPASSPLLPPQSGSRPASIVNSTGATISKSQTNLVEAFNKILNNKNLLPSYKPDLSSPLPAEWGLPLPAQGYRCLECGDAFALEQSLVRHYARRSLRIEVTCNHCAKRLAFFNKCSLLLHAREHKEKGLIMQCSHLVMKPVPVEQMISQQEATVIGASASSLGNAALNQTLSPNKVTLNKRAEAAQYISNKCPECQAQFSSKQEVVEHFQEVKAVQTTPCTECSPPMLLPNSCSAAAHQRIHQGCPLHVCPECGGTAKQSLFQAHLEESCLHFARRIGYRCSSCLVVFGGLNSVKSHIQQAHCDMFHKCPSCPMAFKSAPSTQSHINSQHPTVTEGQTMLIYKCVMCDTVFSNKPLLYVHFDTHLANQKVQVFKCPECTKLFSQRNSLLDHYKTHKTLVLKRELPSPPAPSSRSQTVLKSESSDGKEWMDEDKEEKVKKERIKAPSGWKCAPCHAQYSDRRDYIAHMAEQHGRTLKNFPCNKCDSSFTTTSSMRRHIRDKHKVTSRSFRCKFCSEGKKSFSSRALLERHVKLRHSMDTESMDMSMASGDGADSSSEHDSNMGTRRRRRSAVKKEQDEESTDGVSPVKKLQSSDSAPESGFRCAPCGFTTEDQALFLEHISQHQRGGAEGGGQQCQQCGTCFTSSSSLARHRFITHKIRNAFTENKQQSLSGHPASSPGSKRTHDEKSSLDGSAPASPSSVAPGMEEEGSLTCRVCGKQFEKTSDLNTHFRTHGMAFISARNTGKTI